MPNKTLKTVAKKTHTSMKTVKKAEKIAKKEYPGDWKAIIGTTKKIAQNKKKSEK